MVVQKKDEAKKETVKEDTRPSAQKYRLACQACTGVAEVTTDPTKGGNVVCPHCGKETPRKPEHYILMSI